MPLRTEYPVRMTYEFPVKGRNREQVLENARVMADEWWGDEVYTLSVINVHRANKVEPSVYDRPAQPDAEQESLREAYHSERIDVITEWHATAQTYLYNERDHY